MTTIDTPSTSPSSPQQTSQQTPQQTPQQNPVVDLREQPLEALRLAYDERWRLVAGESAPGAAAEALSRNTAEITALERRCRPQPSVLVRRTTPDPSVFLG